MFNKDKIAKAAQELVDHLEMANHIKGLQAAQKNISTEVAALSSRVTAEINNINNRITGIETELKAIKSDTLLASVKEAQNIVNNVQGNLNQRIQDVSVKIAVMEATNPRFSQIDARASNLLGPKPPE